MAGRWKDTAKAVLNDVSCGPRVARGPEPVDGVLSGRMRVHREVGPFFHQVNVRHIVELSTKFRRKGVLVRWRNGQGANGSVLAIQRSYLSGSDQAPVRWSKACASATIHSRRPRRTSEELTATI